MTVDANSRPPIHHRKKGMEPRWTAGSWLAKAIYLGWVKIYSIIRTQTFSSLPKNEDAFRPRSGPSENSPAIYRWGSVAKSKQSPKRTTGNQAGIRELSRPLHGLLDKCRPDPSTKSAGLFSYRPLRGRYAFTPFWAKLFSSEVRLNHSLSNSRINCSQRDISLTVLIPWASRQSAMGEASTPS